MSNISYILLIPVLLFASSCSNSYNSDKVESSGSSIDREQNRQVSLTPQQVANAEVQTGSPTLDTLSENIQASGMIQLPPNSRASINAPFESFIDKIYYLEGHHVKKGQVLVSLKHPTFIQMQQEYQQAVSQLNFLEQELERQKTLSEANVSAKKKYQQTQAEYDNMKSQRNALAEKLKMIGIDPQSVSNGNIQSTVYLTAPFSGIVANVTGFKGQSVLPQQSILEVLNPKEVYLELNVFEKHINKIAPAQTVNFTISSFENSPTYSAKISSVGSSLDLNSRTITVIAQFNHQVELISGLYVEAKILSDPKTFYTLPEEALIREGDSTFVFVQSTDYTDNEPANAILYDKTMVNVQRTSHGKVGIMLNDKIQENSKVVIHGANYLKSEMSKGEGNDD